MPHYDIVILQAEFYPILDFNLPKNCTYSKTVYQQTDPSQLHDRIRNASIVVLSSLPIDRITLSTEITPNLKFIAVVATGTDNIDVEACRARGIVVSNCRNANVESVSEHAIGFYFAVRRKALVLHEATRKGEWMNGTLMHRILDPDGKHPLTCQEEVAGIIGYGGVGKRIAKLAERLGMKVLVSERKQSSDSTTSTPGRTSFNDVLTQSTVLFIAVPLMPSTEKLLSTPEFSKMSRQAVLVNLSRGGVVDEEALVTALKTGGISGAATDVFLEEPASPENSVLLGDDTKGLNLMVTPHIAWASRMTQRNQAMMMKQIIEDWAAGSPSNVVT